MVKRRQQGISSSPATRRYSGRSSVRPAMVMPTCGEKKGGTYDSHLSMSVWSDVCMGRHDLTPGAARGVQTR